MPVRQSVKSSKGGGSLQGNFSRLRAAICTNSQWFWQYSMLYDKSQHGRVMWSCSPTYRWVSTGKLCCVCEKERLHFLQGSATWGVTCAPGDAHTHPGSGDRGVEKPKANIWGWQENVKGEWVRNWRGENSMGWMQWKHAMNKCSIKKTIEYLLLSSLCSKYSDSACSS